jgi:hypothetical protein
MKKLLLFISLLFCTGLFGQQQFFMLQKTTAGGGTPEYYFLDAADEYLDGSANPLGWQSPNTYNRSAAQLGTAPQTLSNLNKSNAAQSTQTATSVSFTYISGWTGTTAMATTGNDGGVFDDNVLTKGWIAANGAQFKFSGLDNAKQYTLYVLFDAFNWEGGVQSFTVGATTSNQVEQGNNYGNNTTYPNWENDPALTKVINISPSSNEITATINNISGGVPRVTAIILKQQ